MHNPQELIHFFSWISRISMLLPIGFEEQSEDEESLTVIYADDLDEEDKPGARILAKITVVPAPQQQEHLQLAEQRAKLPGHKLISRNEFIHSGDPAIWQQLSIEKANNRQVAIEHYILHDNLLFSVTCIAPASRSNEYLTQFQQTLNSLRLIFLSEENPIIFNPQTGILDHGKLFLSAVLPEGWYPQEDEQGVLRFYGPVMTDFNNYQPTLGITITEPEDNSNNWFAKLLESRLSQLQQSSEYELLEDKTLHLYDLMPARLLRYRWHSDNDHVFHQYQIFVKSGYQSFYLINAATLEPLAMQHTPLFDKIIEEIRFLTAPI